MPATLALAGAELTLASVFGRELRLRTALMEIRRQYDYILIDSPPSLGIFTINALTAADAVIVPLQAHVFALQALPQLEETIAIVRQYIGARRRSGEALLDAARWLSEARAEAQHGEWQVFLEATNTSDDTSRQLLVRMGRVAPPCMKRGSPHFRVYVSLKTVSCNRSLNTVYSR